jgi:tRNA U55 pseudouridine synthase TruB
MRVGNFKLSDAPSWERKELFHQKIQSISEALSDFPGIVVTRRMARGIGMGRQIKNSEIINVSLSPSEITNTHGTFKVSDEDGNLIALAKGEPASGEREFKLLRVFNPEI